MVLEYWGVTSTADFGNIVFTLVDLGLLLSQASDTQEDFEDIFDFQRRVRPRLSLERRVRRVTRHSGSSRR